MQIDAKNAKTQKEQNMQKEKKNSLVICYIRNFISCCKSIV